MSIPVSLCCNIVDPDKAPEEWQTAFYHVEIAEESTVVATELAQEMYLKPEALANGVVVPDLFVSTVHPRHIQRCPGIDYAGLLYVDEERETLMHPLTETFTVCGWVFETGECYSGSWAAHGPVMACVAAWDYFRNGYRQALEITCVHEDTVPRAEWTPTYADPACLCEAAMTSRLKEMFNLDPPPAMFTWKDKVRGFLKQ